MGMKKQTPSPGSNTDYMINIITKRGNTHFELRAD